MHNNMISFKVAIGAHMKVLCNLMHELGIGLDILKINCSKPIVDSIYLLHEKYFLITETYSLNREIINRLLINTVSR